MHKWKMPGTEKLQNYKEGDGIKDEEYAGYYCIYVPGCLRLADYIYVHFTIYSVISCYLALILCVI